MIGIHPNHENLDPNDLIGQKIRWSSWREDQYFILSDRVGKTLFGKFYDEKSKINGSKMSFHIFDGIKRERKHKSWHLVKEDIKITLDEKLFEI